MKKNNTEIKANIGIRILAGIIDYGIIYGFTFLIIFILGKPNSEGTYQLTGAPMLIPIAFWFIMTVVLESGLGGTLGNSLVGLKAIPINQKNEKLTFGQSFKRHLLDPIDMFFFGLPGIITIKNTDKNQRIGDLWAKTIVVKTKNIENINTTENQFVK